VRNRATVAAEALLEGEAERLTREAVERALDSGDSALLRFCLSRILPPARSRRITLELFEGNHAEAVAASVAATVEAVATGLISPLEASGVAALLEVQRRAVETLDLEKRLANLENYRGDPAHFAQRRLPDEPPFSLAAAGRSRLAGGRRVRGAARLRRLERDYARRAFADMTKEEIDDALALGRRALRDGFETLSAEDQKRVCENIFLTTGEHVAP
jgi:hypothetical protein